MEESVIFEKNGVLVTDKRIVVGTNTAPIVNIHSVSLGKRKFILGYLLSIVDAIVESSNFEFSTETREELYYNKEKLLSNGERYEYSLRQNIQSDEKHR